MGSPVKRLGVIGSLVWDRIWGWTPAGRAPVPTEAWGGIAYSLAAASAACPPGWSVVPLLKLGRDLADPALELLRGLPHLELERLLPVDEPTNRVALRYHDTARRCEQLSGGVSGWSAAELLPRLEGLDALYVNYISGFETTLEVAQTVRSAFAGPIYCDLHSLLLGIRADGRRAPRALPRWQEWAACFDVVQVNEQEMRLLGGGAPFSVFADEVLRQGASLAVVTRGAAGVDYAMAARGPLARRPARPEGAAAIGRVQCHAALPGDPTGCGDVWGATLFATLLGGAALGEALAAAHAAARRKLERSGAEGLRHHLAAAVLRDA